MPTVQDLLLRKATIKLAHDKPELRPHLLPLVKEAIGRGVVFDRDDFDLLANELKRIGARKVRDFGSPRYPKRELAVVVEPRISSRDAEKLKKRLEIEWGSRLSIRVQNASDDEVYLNEPDRSGDPSYVTITPR